MKTETALTLGRRIRQFRELKGMNGHTLAELAGFKDKQYIYKVETGKATPSLDRLESIADALDVPIYRLFMDDRVRDEIAVTTEFRNSIVHGTGTVKAPSLLNMIKSMAASLTVLSPVQNVIQRIDQELRPMVSNRYREITEQINVDESYLIMPKNGIDGSSADIDDIVYLDLAPDVLKPILTLALAAEYEKEKIDAESESTSK